MFIEGVCLHFREHKYIARLFFYLRSYYITQRKYLRFSA